MTDLFLTLTLLIGGYYLYNRVIKPLILEQGKKNDVLDEQDNHTEDIDYEEVD